MSAHLATDHQQLVDATRDFARGELLSRDREWDRNETSCCVELARLYDMGLMGLRVPERAGGMECPVAVYARLIQELAYASPSVAVTVAVHNMVAEILGMFGSEEVRADTLPRLSETGNLSAFAITEPDAGSDPGAAKTRAEATAGGWRLHGAKMWVTNGMTGRWFVVLARITEQGSAARELSMFLLDAEQAELKRRPIHGKMGIRGSETAEMSLEGVFVPEANLLGQAGWGLRIALTALDGGRIGIASQAAGIAAACVDLMTGYARERRQFGRPLADFQAIQWMLADSVTELAASRLLIDRAAELKDAGRPFTSEASMAKLYASEAATRIADRAVQVHGGYGFVNEFRVEQLYRDARITRIYEGTSEIQRHVIAREVLQA